MSDMREIASDLAEALMHCLGWIDAWDPAFAQDDEWPEYRANFNAALARFKDAAEQSAPEPATSDENISGEMLSDYDPEP